MKAQSKSEEYRECIIDLMRQRGVVELPFSETYKQLKDLYTDPLTRRVEIRADNLRNAILIENGPLDLTEGGTKIVLLDASRLIRDAGSIVFE
jgi:hypothetical protein